MEPSSVVVEEQIMDETTERGVEEERQVELALQPQSEQSLAIDHAMV
jgi:hypothetical protein